MFTNIHKYLPLSVMPERDSGQGPTGDCLHQPKLTKTLFNLHVVLLVTDISLAK